jgi:hypothetical protein
MLTVPEQPSVSDTPGSSNMAPFLTKLFQIVSANTTDRCIMWTAKGDSFVIIDPDSFARDILPTYFKHNNIRSFIRQLNTYGFRKRTNISSTDEHLEFFHEKFRRDDPALLTQITRCHQPKASQAQRPAGIEMGAPQMAALMPPGMSGMAGMAGMPGMPGMPGMGGPPAGSGDLDNIRNRVTELKTRLGSLQAEIRDYNQQMEQKVNILMHVLQTSSAPSANSQLQQQLMMLQQQQQEQQQQQQQQQRAQAQAQAQAQARVRVYMSVLVPVPVQTVESAKMFG